MFYLMKIETFLHSNALMSHKAKNEGKKISTRQRSQQKTKPQQKPNTMTLTTAN